MNVDYKCKFCGREGVLILLDEGLEMFIIEKWKPWLSCNRCSDYMERKRTEQFKIEKACVFLGQSRQTLLGPKLLQVESGVRVKLVEITKRYAAIVCDYYRKTNVWEEEFVNMLVDRPDRMFSICAQYIRGIKAIR